MERQKIEAGRVSKRIKKQQWIGKYKTKIVVILRWHICQML